MRTNAIARRFWDKPELMLIALLMLIVFGMGVAVLLSDTRPLFVVAMAFGLAGLGASSFWREWDGSVEGPAKVELASSAGLQVAILCSVATAPAGSRLSQYVLLAIALVSALMMVFSVRTYRRRHLPRRSWLERRSGEGARPGA